MDAKRYQIRYRPNVAVSIHAPVMDANDNSADKLLDLLVSIHAPVMDANPSSIIAAINSLFQSTRP